MWLLRPPPIQQPGRPMRQLAFPLLHLAQAAQRPILGNRRRCPRAAPRRPPPRAVRRRCKVRCRRKRQPPTRREVASPLSGARNGTGGLKMSLRTPGLAMLYEHLQEMIDPTRLSGLKKMIRDIATSTAGAMTIAGLVTMIGGVIDGTATTEGGPDQGGDRQGEGPEGLVRAEAIARGGLSRGGDRPGGLGRGGHREGGDAAQRTGMIGYAPAARLISPGERSVTSARLRGQQNPSVTRTRTRENEE